MHTLLDLRGAIPAFILPVAPNLLSRDFSPSAPDLAWSSDITHIATDEGWLYLAAVIDLFSRQVVEHAAAHASQPGDGRVAHGRGSDVTRRLA